MIRDKKPAVLRVDLTSLFGGGHCSHFLSADFRPWQDQRITERFEEFIRSLSNGSSPITASFNTESTLTEVRNLAKNLRCRCSDVLILGIGGSTLGFRSILQALRGPYHNLMANAAGEPRVFVLDNVDPVLATQVSSILDLKQTALVYISKSGATPEPAANFVYFHKLFRAAKAKPDNVAIICDPADNGINRIAKQIGAHIFHIPPELPGRYTVLSPVGIFPAELVGIDGASFLAGARYVHQALLREDAHTNPVFLLAAALAELAKHGKTIHALFSYSNLLSEVGLWFVQLWAESLGKKLSNTGEVIHAGTTPISALGATDQHSVLQLFKEGPNDKVIGFLTVDCLANEVQLTKEFNTEIDYNYFAGHSMAEQLRLEQRSTQMSLYNANRPSYCIELSDLSPLTLGAFFYFMECVTVFMAYMWDVNPFDQPGVEEGKRITYSVMGKENLVQFRGKYQEDMGALSHPDYRHSISLF